MNRLLLKIRRADLASDSERQTAKRTRWAGNKAVLSILSALEKPK
ncbi:MULTISPECIES: hypothetical protein [unclassified Pedobacter]|nr:MULTISPECIES: hypothetical protein [unclassified Pedobacter]